MASGYTDVVTDPRAFFEREMEDPSMLIPIFLVLLVGAVGAVAAWIEWTLISEFIEKAAKQAVEGENQQEAQNAASMIAAIGGAFSVAVTFVKAFVGWLYYGLFFFGLTSLLSDEGEFRDAMVVAGWGFLPKLVEGLFRIVGNWYLTTSLTVPDEINQSGQRAFQEQLAGNPVAILLVVVGILSLGWSAYIWYEGVQVGGDLDTQEALIVVGIPVGLVLLTRLLNLVRLLS